MLFSLLTPLWTQSSVYRATLVGGVEMMDSKQGTDKGTFFLSKGAANEMLRKVEERKLPKPL